MNEPIVPLLTFYMTVKNGMPFLVDAVNSIKSQTYKNIEAVIVDDGSSDGTVCYLRELEKSDFRFRVVYTSGVGRAKALNLALSASRGDFVANLDADDCVHAQRAEIQVKILKESEASFLASGCKIIFDDEIFHSKPISSVADLEVIDVTRLIFKSNPINHSSATFRRDVIISLGGYDESRMSQVDYDLWIRLAASGTQLLRIKEKLVAKRIHKEQSFENKKRINYLFSSVRLQFSAISKLDAGFYYYAYPVLRLFYGLLPQKIRALLKG